MTGNHDHVRFLREQAARLREIAKDCALPESNEILALARELEEEANAWEAKKP